MTVKTKGRKEWEMRQKLSTFVKPWNCLKPGDRVFSFSRSVATTQNSHGIGFEYCLHDVLKGLGVEVLGAFVDNSDFIDHEFMKGAGRQATNCAAKLVAASMAHFMTPFFYESLRRGKFDAAQSQLKVCSEMFLGAELVTYLHPEAVKNFSIARFFSTASQPDLTMHSSRQLDQEHRALWRHQVGVPVHRIAAELKVPVLLVCDWIHNDQ